jgi:ABC-type nickel/cobalt efflux system permease component RcnA
VTVRRLVVAVAVAGALLSLAAPAAAHPLGSFTINHYSGIRVAPDSVLIDHVVDMAEIPTFAARADMDTDGDGRVGESESAAYRASSCDRASRDLQLSVDGELTVLRPIQSGLSFPQGQGAFTLRVVCILRSDTSGRAFTFRDAGDVQRIGWREVVVQGDRMRVTDSDAPASSLSARLTSYPVDLLAAPSDQSTATWTAIAGGPALPAFEAPDAQADGDSVAGGAADLGGEVTALFQARELTLPIVLLALLAAAALGALHALSPGHGKTVMAAYLVGSRGSARHALALGLTVTVSHTLGVVMLAVLSLSASSVVPPERLYPILGLVSGILVVAIGVWLVAARVRELLRQRAEARAHEPAHAFGHEHPHEHEHPGHGHEHAHDDEADGWHSHGGRRHTHLPAGKQPLRWRGLFALGLAGGLVPSASALILLLGSLSAGRPAFGLVLTIAFGAGMAVVLAGIGLGLVYARGLVERLPTGGFGQRMSRAVSAVTALIVLVAGIMITTQAALTL